MQSPLFIITLEDLPIIDLSLGLVAFHQTLVSNEPEDRSMYPWYSFCKNL
jgi:hypothetical protein